MANTAQQFLEENPDEEQPDDQKAVLDGKDMFTHETWNFPHRPIEVPAPMPPVGGMFGAMAGLFGGNGPVQIPPPVQMPPAQGRRG